MSRIAFRRKIGESIWIDESRVELNAVMGIRASLCVEGPRRIPVYRSELTNTKRSDSNQITRIIITRRIGESFIVGDAKLTVEKVGIRSVKLLIEAPLRVSVQRDEIKKMKESSNEKAS